MKSSRGRFLFAFVFLACSVLAAADMPQLQKTAHGWQFLVDGKPFLMLGGQVNNSSGWAAALPGATGFCAAGAFAALGWRRFAVARIAAAGEVVLILIGWSLAQYPNLITPDVTVENACAPAATLRLLVLALAAGAVVLLPSLVFLFRLFKGGRMQGQGGYG